MLWAAWRWSAVATILMLVGCGGGFTDSSPSPHSPDVTAYVASAGSNAILVHDIGDETAIPLKAASAAAAGTSPLSIAVHPSGAFIYAANLLSFDVSAFRVEPQGGQLAPIARPLSTGSGASPLSVAVHPSGRFAYVAASNLLDSPVSGQILSYSIDSASGMLQRLAPPLAAGVTPIALAFEPAGSRAYVVDADTDRVWTLWIDPSTGTAAIAGPDYAAPTGSRPSSIAIDRTGRVAYVANSNSNDVSIFFIDPAIGKLIAAGTVTAGQGPVSVAIHPSGRFVYVANAGSNDVSVYAADDRTGLLHPVGDAVPAGRGPRHLSLSPGGASLYVVNVSSNDISAYAVDPDSGTLAPLGAPVPTGVQPTAIAIVGRGGPGR